MKYNSKNTINFKNDTFESTKIKSFYSENNIVKKLNRQATGWKIMFGKHTFHKGPLSEIYKIL